MSSRLTLWVLRLLPVLGTILLVVGAKEWYPAGMLDSKGFLINLASSVTTACFGVPIAFFVLQDLLRSRENRESKRQVLTYAEAEIGELFDIFVGMMDLASELAGSARRGATARALEDLVNKIFKAHSAVKVLMESEFAHNNSNKHDRTWQDAARAVSEVLGDLERLGISSEESWLKGRIDEFEQKWLAVLEDVIPRCRLEGMSLPSDILREIGDFIGRSKLEQNLASIFFDRYKGSNQTYGAQRTTQIILALNAANLGALRLDLTNLSHFSQALFRAAVACEDLLEGARATARSL